MRIATTVLLCDGHAPLRAALRAFLAAETDMTVVGEAGTTGEVLAKVGALNPDVVVLDLDIPNAETLELVHTIKGRAPTCKVLLVGLDGSASQFHGALQAGASGWILRNALGVELVRAIRSVSRGGHPYAEQHKTV